MGFWYFLLLFAGIFFIGKGILGKKNFGWVFGGLLCISFSIFMFSPGSDVIISKIFNLD